MLDAVTFTVIHRRLESIARAMQHTLVRSSRSGVIASGHDCSCCILTAGCELLSVAETIPIHVMSGADRMAQTMKRFHPKLVSGDAFLHNSPYHGCTHAADLSILVPVMDTAGKHRFTVLAKSHQADIGNSKPTTYMADAIDVYEEGALLFPAVRLQRDFQMVEDIVRIGRMRIRAPDQWYGDLLALVGAARTGEAALDALAADFGWDVLDEFAAEWLNYSETEMGTAISRLPAGRETGESTHDAFPGTPPEGITVKASVDVQPDRAKIVVDLTDNLDCLPNGLNLSEATARSAALIGVFNSLGAIVPVNAGSVRRVEVLLREGCVVGIPNPTTSCSVATTNLSDRVVNAVHQAMAALGDGLGQAEAGAIEGPVGAVISGLDPRRSGQSYINQLALSGTAGAAGAQADGWLTMGNACTAGMWTMDSVEVDELNYPLRVLERRLLRDTEGAGTWRGAPSCRVVYEPCGATMQLHYAADGCQNPARGVRGGGSGGAVRQWLVDKQGHWMTLDSSGSLSVRPGEKIVADTSGGGGYGPPYKRLPEAVAHDVAQGYVSPERARDVYAVILNTEGHVNIQATCELRDKHKHEERLR